jgi:glycosyltransferase involved in cell wall biosynthesis
LIPRLDSGFCVREAGVKTLRERFPAWAPHINFVPTWVDVEVFHPELDATRNAQARSQARSALGHGNDMKLIVTVGRIDAQKNPDLLFDAFARVAQTRHDVALIYIGDGVLREALQARVRASGLGDRVHFMGLRPQREIASLLRSADVFALSSAYEGMPMALLEGLGAGLPVVTTDVGEVRKVVSARCGEVVEQPTPEAFGAALDRVLCNLSVLAGEPCLHAIDNFKPAKVLEPVYDNYRQLGARGRQAAHAGK